MTYKHRTRKDARGEVSRRKFLAGVAVAGAATTAGSPAVNAATAASARDAAVSRAPSALSPSMRVAAAEIGTPKDLPRIVALTPAGKSVDVRLWHDGKVVDRQVKVSEMEENVAVTKMSLSG